ncbi:MAG: AAA family ATPase [Alkalibacterium sp.]|nr:AAA family ATPase [Alkalibacterium sp.]
MQFSHSRVDLFSRCPWHFKLRYIDKLTELNDLDPGNPLIIGNALHYGIEVGDKDLMTQYYYDSFPVLTDKVINESIKLDLAYDKVKPILEGINIKHQEYNIDEPEFRGIIDLITENEDGTVDIFDFKYSNNVDNYNDSLQLHIYRHYLEQQGFKVNKLGYIFIPKIFIRQKKNEELSQFRKRLVTEYESKNIQLIEVPKDDMAMVYFVNKMTEIKEALDNPHHAYLPNPNGECYQCKYGQDYLELIEKDDEIMALPKNKRRELTVDLKPDFWIYADSYVGKSTFVDAFDDVLFINTDGNTDNTTSPIVSVSDTVTKKGRIKETHYGWEAFKETVDDLTTDDNDFQIVAIDLLEDMYELCRTYVFDKNNIEHESDSGFGKGWDLVKKEFIDTIKRLKSLNYQIVFISKESRKEINQKSGASYTTFSPNMKEKNANILSGVVDLTIHAEKDGDDRYINLITDEHTFGGGRFNFKNGSCELDRKAFEQALKDAQTDRTATKKEESKAEQPAEQPSEQAQPEKTVESEPKQDEPKQDETFAESLFDTADSQADEAKDTADEPEVKTRKRRRRA